MPQKRVRSRGLPARLAGRRGWRRLTATGLPAVLALGGVLPVLLPRPSPAAAGPSRFVCRGWQYCDAHGYSSYHYGAHQGQSYWRMTPGDECTNYAAFVEATVYHVARPSFLLGNGGQWAAAAAAHGIVVNNRPSVGAVAEWDPWAFGMGGFGHVAVVEEVGPRGSYIVISQQHTSGQRDDYDWTLIKAHYPASMWQEWPSHFIHFRIPQRADVGYFSPRSNTVSLRDSQTHGPVNYSGRLPVTAGSRALPLTGDWRGTGTDSLGFYSPRYGMFHLLAGRRTRHGLVNLEFAFGPPGMIPLVGDWRGTGRAGVGYYNPRTGAFSLRQSLTPGRPDETFAFGPPGMIPVVGNWNGGRRDQIGYYNPRTGTFTLGGGLGSGRAYLSFRFGPAHMIPIVGNWNVGARDGVGYYDPRTGAFYLRVPLSRGPASEIIRFGPARMIPLIGDWFGDRRN